MKYEVIRTTNFMGMREIESNPYSDIMKTFVKVEVE